MNLSEQTAPLAADNLDVNAILAKRAKIIARRNIAKPQSELMKVVCFSLNYERYALEINFVQEVCALRDYVPIPGVPHFVLGIVNVHGRIVSIVNLKVLFDLPGKGLTDHNQMIILRNKTMEFAVLADAITGVNSIPLATCQSTLPTLTDLRADYLKAITDERVIVLDGARLLNDPRMIVRQKSDPD